MDVNTFIQIVNGVGFPIAACIAMACFIVWERKSNAEKNAKTAERNEQVLSEVKKSVDNNTQTLERLIEKLDRKGEL